jgi:hypothetical protein
MISMVAGMCVLLIAVDAYIHRVRRKGKAIPAEIIEWAIGRWL